MDSKISGKIPHMLEQSVSKFLSMLIPEFSKVTQLNCFWQQDRKTVETFPNICF